MPMHQSEKPVAINLGSVASRFIRSTVGPLNFLPQHHVTYPTVVIQALGELFMEYNREFLPLVERNREWSKDYQFAFDSAGIPVNCGVQIDMVGLTPEFLTQSASMSVREVREILRGKIFELENSLAMYQLLQHVCAESGRESYFRPRFRAVLNDLRQQWNMPIALLAVTDQKHVAMMSSEFGKNPGEVLTDNEVLELSGFDRFFGPAEFCAYLASNGGRCDYLLYVRSSDPVDKLKRPTLEVEHPLLGDPELRRVIKANSLTFNVDAPEMEYPRRINDTKEYMAPMRMAFEIQDVGDLLSGKVQKHLAAGNSFGDFSGQRLSDGFLDYLAVRGVNHLQVESGETCLRAKPGKGTYGCYGHVRGPLHSSQKFRKELALNIRQRGAYVIQPELETPRVINSVDGVEYTFIDRNFMGIIAGQPCFLGGFRSMMPSQSVEAKNGRIHGNGATVWADIVGPDAA